MATFGERFLLGFTSPRSPYLISKYIKIIEENNLEGRIYDKSFQEDFYNVLSLERVAGEETGNAKNKALAGRDKLTRMPQALGFFITQSGKKFEITSAGKLLKDDYLFEDVLLHQILKYQLPSSLHKDSLKNKGYFKIKPFLELIRLINQLNYLTYQELLIFGMTLTNFEKFDETVQNIKLFRAQRKEIKKQKKSLRTFNYETQCLVFEELYSDIITSGNIATRESPTDTEEKFRKKKMSNWADYTDSIFRILRASGIVVFTQGRSLSISPDRQNEVDFLLANVSREIENPDMPREEFDQYISNPNIPLLLNDNKNNLISNLNKINESIDGQETVYELKRLLAKKRFELREAKRNNQRISLKEKGSQDVEDILRVFDMIKNKQIEPASMRPTFFEWNVWRAMTMINHGNVKGNFLIDDSGMPISTAGGSQSDIVGDYGKFDIGIEVTLSRGQKQYEMEGEPVTRHIGKMQLNKPSFGIFIAEKLHETVISYFYTSLIHNSKAYNGFVDIIPMDTNTFIKIFKEAVQNDIVPEDLYSIHEYSLAHSRNILVSGKTEEDWHNGVLEEFYKVVSSKK